MPYGNDNDPVVTEIEVSPAVRTLQRGGSQQIEVVAIYSDGQREDITRTAQYGSNNTELANVSESRLVTLSQRAGDAAIMARYQGRSCRSLEHTHRRRGGLLASREYIVDHWSSRTEDLGIPAASGARRCNFHSSGHAGYRW